MRNHALMLIMTACFVGWASNVQDDGRPDTISPAEAIERIGESQLRVAITVKHAKDRLSKRGILFLDSEEDFMDPKNLGVAIAPAVADELRTQGATDLEAFFLGKSIEVTGSIMRFEERPYLPVLRLDQIRFVENR